MAGGTARRTPATAASGLLALSRHPGFLAYRRYLPLLGLGVALTAGAVVRLRFILPADFPLNDGGLFYVMARDIQGAGYALPSFTTYNNEGIPFAYPPLPLYLAAALDDLTPLSLLDVLRFLPFAANALTIVFVFLLARSLTRSDTVASISAIAFALMPRSYLWMIMGGGLTRGLAFLFATIAVYEAYLLFTTGRRRDVVLTTVFGALTVYSHPEVAWVLAFSCALLFLFYGRDPAGVRNSAIVIVVLAVLTAPWWATVIVRHGTDPLVSAAQTGAHSWYAWKAFIGWGFTEQPLLNWPAVLGLLGAVVLLANGRPFVPVWLVAIVLLEPRSAGSYTTIPLAILSATCIEWLVLSLPRAVGSPSAPWLPGDATSNGLARCVRQSAPVAAVALFAAYMLALSVYAALQAEPLLSGLSGAQRESIVWAGENTRPDSTFAVVTGITAGFADGTSEWFPALSERTSVATLQGSEWLGRKRYDAQAARSVALQDCASKGVECLDAWSQHYGADYGYVFIAAGCCQKLADSLASSARYELVAEVHGALIFRPVSAAP